VIGEDSGLLRAAARRRTGRVSARYAGTHGDDQPTTTNSSAQMASLSSGQRSAYTSARRSSPTRRARWFGSVEGRCNGVIVTRAVAAGLRLRPAVLVVEYGQTFGELPPEVKQQMSHRAEGVRATAGRSSKREVLANHDVPACRAVFSRRAHSRSFGAWAFIDPAGQLELGQGAVCSNATAKADTRAQYGGFTLGMGVFLFVAFARREWTTAGLAASAIHADGLRRGTGVSLAADGPVSPIIIYLLAGEGTCGVLSFAGWRNRLRAQPLPSEPKMRTLCGATVQKCRIRFPSAALLVKIAK